MNSMREHSDEFALSSADEVPAPGDVSAAIGTDERRMHVRAYNYWVSLLDGRDFPSIEDLEPSDIEDFSSHSVLLDFTCGVDNPAVPYIGTAIRDECALDDDVNTIADVPSRSLLSRLTDHYMQIIANRAPVGFEAEFDNPRGDTICYRGILMPFSSDGDAIDFIYGVINWKRVDTSATDAFPAVIAPRDDSVATIEPDAFGDAADEAFDEVADEVHNLPTEDGDSLDPTEAMVEPVTAVPDDAFADIADETLPQIRIDENCGLADRLWAARETADAVKAGEARTRAALYQALSLAYDFAAAARENPADYAELLEESGVKAQTRAPMTPIVKLVFGVDYDKARLTEFAAALSYAQRQDVPIGGFHDFIGKTSGGLKALVAAERQARRPDTRPDTQSEAARIRLRAAPSMSLADVSTEEEFAVVVTRRGADGRHEAVAIVDDDALIERVIRQVG